MTEDYRESIPRKVRKTDLKAQVEEELLRFIKHMDLSVNSKMCIRDRHHPGYGGGSAQDME